MNIFKEGYDEDGEEYQDMLEYEEKIIEQYNWKEFNTKKVSDLLDFSLKEKLFDQSVLNKREQEMLENIQEKSIDDGKIVIVTGADHIDYFHDNLKNSCIPLRD